MMRFPRNCPHCAKALRPSEFDMHLRFFCGALLGRELTETVLKEQDKPMYFENDSQ